MILYIVAIAGANVFMILLSVFHNVYSLPLWQILVASIGGTIGVIAIDGFFAFFVNTVCTFMSMQKNFRVLIQTF